MGDGIATGVLVRVTGPSSTERGTEGIVKTVRPGWAGREAVVVVAGILRSREVAIPLSDLSKK
ncbi:hypothetical protein [Promicromonospora iranensis]|uniref:KOW motif-containing protein n=1 Tax=Promicromonospora iranensis TaxID=1105144 RepID=A0ABU2CKZ2_9MICO|nr:hypothetical protein [Promicromonospora iranensis]MDR7381999.1 hypothetical protein [Promicromonospora iranensis]